MSIWRPSNHIRVKAIGLHWRNGKLLAAEVPTDTGHIKGVRPLGGTVEFGETWQEALKREFLEELGQHIQILGPPIVLENIYHHEGELGHEIIFVAEVSLPDGPILSSEIVTFQEDNGQNCVARWFSLDKLDTGELELYPTGLKSRLAALSI